MDKPQFKFKVSYDHRETIDIKNTWEVDYWRVKLECSYDELISAEKEVGNRIHKIKESISLTRKGSRM